MCPPCMAQGQTMLSEAVVQMGGDQAEPSGLGAPRSARCLLVMEGNRLQGILTPGDVVRHLAAGRSPATTPIAEVMTQPVITVSPAALADLATLLHTLSQHAIQHLPVVEGDRVLGVVTSKRVQQALWTTWQDQFPAPNSLLAPPTKTASHLLYSLTQALSEAENFDTALNVTLRQICEFTGWVYGEVWLVGSDRTQLTLGNLFYEAHSGLSRFREASTTLTLALGDGLPGRVWMSQQPEWIADLSQFDCTVFARQQEAQACGLQGGIGVPILANHQTVAVLVFLSQAPLLQQQHVLDCVSSVTLQLGQLIQRKQTEEALRVSEATNRAIIQAIPDLLIRANRQGEHLEILSYGNIKGVMWPSPKRSKDWGALPEPLVEQRLRAIEVALATQTIQTYEHCLEIEGELCSEEVRVVPMDDTSVLVMVRDVTDHRTVEQNFYQTEVIQRALVEAIPDGLLRINRQGECLDLLSSGNQNTISFCSKTVCSPNTQLRSQTIEQAFATGRLQRYEQCIEQDGQRRWKEVRIRPLGRDDALVIIRDITESRQAEAALRQSEARFRSTFEQAAVGICRASTHGFFLHVNQQFCKILGYTEAELLRLSFQEVTYPEDLEQDLTHIQQLLEGKIQTYVREKRYLRRDGQPIWANLTVSLVRSPTGDPQEFIAVVKDVTDRKHAEEALRQSEAMNRAIIESIPDLLIRVDREGRHLEMLSGGSLRAILRPSGDSSTYTFFDVLPPDVAAQRAAAIQRAWETQSLQVYEQELELEGDRCWEEVRVTPLTGTEVLVIVRDITDRKRAEDVLRQLNQELESRVEERTAALRASEERWQLALDSYDAGIWDWDLVTDITFRSPRWKQIRGLPEDAVGTEVHEWSDRIHPHDRERVLAALQNYINHNAPSYQEEYRVQHAEGHYIWILDQGRALWNEQGQAVRMVGAEIDITERKQTEAALRESEDRFRRIFEQSPVGIAITDLDGNIVRTNASLAAILNYSMPELLHQSLQELLQISAESDHLLHHLLDQTLSMTTFEQKFLSVQGEECWVTVATSCIFNAFGRPTSLVHLVEDITERKRSEAEAQLLRERLQFVLSASPVIIYACNPAAPFDATFISENVLELLGYSAAEWLADPSLWARLIHPDDAPRALHKLDALLHEGRYTSEYRFLDKAGHYHWILDEQKLIRDADGEPIDIVGYMADISDRKQTELLLQSQQQFLRQLIDTIPHLIFVKDREGCFTLANQALAHFYGTTVEELVGKTSASFNPNPAEIEYFQSADRSVIDSGNPCIVEEVITSALGYQGYFQTVKVPILSPSGQSRSVLGVATNITLRKQIEDQLRKSEAHLMTAQRIAQLGSWEFNIQTRTIHWSEQTYEIFGRNPAEGDLTYEEFQQYIHPDDLALLEQTTRAVIEQQQPLEVEYRVCRPDGKIRYVLSRAGLVVDESGQPVITNDRGDAKLIIGTVLDITDRRQAEIQLQHINERLTLTNAELDRATRLKDEFLANMSHELRTPLNAILGMTEGLQDEVFGPLDDRQKRPLEMIERSGRHLLALINDILDLSKIEAGKLELQLAPIAVKYLCDSSLTFVRQQAVKKGLTLTLDIPDALPPITVDELRVRQILINLLSNAVKFTPEGGSVVLTVAPEVQNGQPLLRFSITDTGIGIDANDLEKLFQSFVQLDSSLNRQQSGTGLGLALVRRLVDLHQGLTAVTSTPGEGSCFTVWLPYTVSAPQHALDARPRASIISSHNKRALVIEDSAAASEQIARYLKAMDREVTVYQQGEGAVQVALGLQPGLIILDILLPNQSGWETLKQLKAHPQTKSIPVIIVSVVDERSRGLALGAVEYLVKPISQDEFRATLKNLMQQSGAASLSTSHDPGSSSDGTATRSPVILLVEDNTMNVITVSNYLAARGFRLLEARNGHEAIAQAIAHQPDLILMDIQMPEMDGLEAMRRIRAEARTANTPIIALTALTMPGDRDRCLEAGATDYVAKPIKLKQLTELIESILHSQFE